MTAVLKRTWPPERVSDLVGIEFELGGRGPKVIDCEGVVRHGLKLLGIDWEDQGPALLAGYRRGDLDIPSCFPGRDWVIKPADTPRQPGDVLIFGEHGMAVHVALVIDGDFVLQATEGYRSCVVRAERVRRVQAVARFVGRSA